MKAESQSLREIFQGTVRYAVPLYQRPYVWRHTPDDPENDRLGPFWEDVRQTVDRLLARKELVDAAGGDEQRVAPMTPHFFGAVVVDGPVTMRGGIRSHEVIDGQQRLTTTQLLIAAATRMCDKRGRPNDASRLRKLWTQDDDVEDITEAERLKLVPTKYDKAAFDAVLGGQAVGPVGSKPAAAYTYFSSELASWFDDIPDGMTDKYVAALRETIYEHLLLVVIELQAGDNPQGIFESLNAQGEKLLAIDLVKNHLFRAAKQTEIDLDNLDANVWSARFGDDWWRIDVRQGRYKRPRAELFLMHWLTEQGNAEVSATGLFVEFVRIATPELRSRADTERFISRFVDDAGTYRSFDGFDYRSREGLFFARRDVLDAGVVFPVALRLWRNTQEGRITRDRLVDGLRALESWLVRRMVLRLTTKRYNKVMVELLGKMASAEDPVAAMVESLAAPGPESLDWWPDDERFRGHLLTQDIYGSRAMTVARTRMLLEAVEASLWSNKTETFAIEQKLTIEHVIPQTWKDTWPLPESATPEEREVRQNHIHKLGNLTLVTGSLNPAMSNDPWAEKRGDLVEHSALRLNARLVVDHPDVFDEASIDARSAILADLLIAEWPGPGSASWLAS